VPEAGVELPAFELESSGEWEGIQLGGGRVSGTAEESGPGALAILGAGGKGGQQGVCSGLGGVPGECALRLRNDAHGVWAGLAVLQRPEADGGVVQGLPQWPELLPAGAVEGLELRGPSSHGKLGGGGSSKVGSVALSWAGACEAKAAVAEGEGDLVGEGPVCVGVGRGGEGAVVLGTLHGGADVLPPASPGQVRYPLLEAPLDDQPPVLVSQGQCQELLRKVAGVSGAAVGVGCLERRGADGGAGSKETVGCVAHAQVAGD
jgi:hypothetical protein